jgi:hypothetical protein
MAATNIGSNKYPLAKIPAMADPADIQIALKYYHWGQETEPETTPAPAGISKYLDELDGRIDTLETDIDNVVLESIVDAKGDLIVGTGANAVDRLARGSDGYYLKANESLEKGLEWSALPTASTSISGIVQLSDSISSSSTTLAATANAVKNVNFSKSPLNYPIIEKTANYELELTDAYSIIEMNSGSANSLTIPLNATDSFDIGCQITVIQLGLGQTTINVLSGVTLYCTPQGTANTAKLRTQYSSCTLIKRAENVWIAIGDLVA